MRSQEELLKESYLQLIASSQFRNRDGTVNYAGIIDEIAADLGHDPATKFRALKNAVLERQQKPGFSNETLDLVLAFYDKSRNSSSANLSDTDFSGITVDNRTKLKNARLENITCNSLVWNVVDTRKGAGDKLLSSLTISNPKEFLDEFKKQLEDLDKNDPFLKELALFAKQHSDGVAILFIKQHIETHPRSHAETAAKRTYYNAYKIQEYKKLEALEAQQHAAQTSVLTTPVSAQPFASASGQTEGGDDNLFFTEAPPTAKKSAADFKKAEEGFVEHLGKLSDFFHIPRDASLQLRDSILYSTPLENARNFVAEHQSKSRGKAFGKFVDDQITRPGLGVEFLRGFLAYLSKEENMPPEEPTSYASATQKTSDDILRDLFHFRSQLKLAETDPKQREAEALFQKKFEEYIGEQLSLTEDQKKDLTAFLLQYEQNLLSLSHTLTRLEYLISEGNFLRDVGNFYFKTIASFKKEDNKLKFCTNTQLFFKKTYPDDKIEIPLCNFEIKYIIKDGKYHVDSITSDDPLFETLMCKDSRSPLTASEKLLIYDKFRSNLRMSNIDQSKKTEWLPKFLEHLGAWYKNTDKLELIGDLKTTPAALLKFYGAASRRLFEAGDMRSSKRFSATDPGARLLQIMQYAQQNPNSGEARALRQAYYDAYKAQIQASLYIPDADKRTLIESLLNLADELNVKKDLSDLNLSGANLGGLDFRNVSFRGSNLDGAYFDGAKFNVNTDFRDTQFTNILGTSFTFDVNGCVMSGLKYGDMGDATKTFTLFSNAQQDPVRSKDNERLTLFLYGQWQTRKTTASTEPLPLTGKQLAYLCRQGKTDFSYCKIMGTAGELVGPDGKLAENLIFDNADLRNAQFENFKTYSQIKNLTGAKLSSEMVAHFAADKKLLDQLETTETRKFKAVKFDYQYDVAPDHFAITTQSHTIGQDRILETNPDYCVVHTQKLTYDKNFTAMYSALGENKTFAFPRKSTLGENKAITSTPTDFIMELEKLKSNFSAKSDKASQKIYNQLLQFVRFCKWVEARGGVDALKAMSEDDRKKLFEHAENKGALGFFSRGPLTDIPKPYLDAFKKGLAAAPAPAPTNFAEEPTTPKGPSPSGRTE